MELLSKETRRKKTQFKIDCLECELANTKLFSFNGYMGTIQSNYERIETLKNKIEKLQKKLDRLKEV